MQGFPEGQHPLAGSHRAVSSASPHFPLDRTPLIVYYYTNQISNSKSDDEEYGGISIFREVAVGASHKIESVCL